ncbi:hypothetical protein YC2023_034255 [Brassica napus]
MKKIQSVDVCILSQDTSNYLLLQWSLTTSLKSSNNLVETVAIRNVRVNQSDHQLMVDILIFPQGREGFTQTTLALQMYKGVLPSREAIAIKRAKPESLEGALEFKTEIEFCRIASHESSMDKVP